MKIAELRKKRAAAYDAFKAVAEKDILTEQETKDYPAMKKSVTDYDDQITRATEAQELAAASAEETRSGDYQAGRVKGDVWTDEEAAKERGLGTCKGLVVGGIVKMLVQGGGSIHGARQAAKDIYGKAYGENHPVIKALNTSTGSAGGFIVPPEQMTEIIPLLRAQAVVRSAGPRNIPMPRGSMTIPGQGSAATASYGAEGARIASSQQTLNQIAAFYKKLTALVPVSNDMMRYADPAVDAFVRDDLVKVLALTEDLNFILGSGGQDTPRGYLSFANGWVAKGGGTVGVYSTTANSTFAVNGTDPVNSTGGNFITSTAIYTLATVSAELGGAVNRLDSANVPENKRCWFMHPRSYNYLFNAQNSLGVYVWRDELTKGTLFGYPVKKTTQIGANYYNGDGSRTDCSFVFLVEMTEDMILDSMQLELAVFREGSYVDANGNTISAMQYDQTVIRAISEHDHQMRHDAAVAVIQGVRWAPAIS